MRSFDCHEGLVLPMDRANVDTDMIIPKQFLKSIHRTGYGPFLFDELRYLDTGYPGQDCTKRPLNESFSLNDPRYQGASILLTRDNFGCGSSREHAVWALDEFGIRVIIAPGFADIFYNNCFKNGLLPVILPAEGVDALFAKATAAKGVVVAVDLPRQTVTAPGGIAWTFAVDKFRKRCLLDGLDDIGVTLKQTDAIVDFERRWKDQCPWLFSRPGAPS